MLCNWTGSHAQNIIFSEDFAGGKEVTEEIQAFLEKDLTNAATAPIRSSMSLLVHPTIVQQQALVRLDLGDSSPVHLELFNQHGQRVITLLSKEQREKGSHYFILESGFLPDGLYFLQARSAQELLTEKLVVQRR